MGKASEFSEGMGGWVARLGRKPAVAQVPMWVPPNLIAGSERSVGEDDQLVAEQLAQDALGTDRLHVVVSRYHGRMYYLAAPSSDFASRGATVCPFAGVLPGMPEMGDDPQIFTFVQDNRIYGLVIDPRAQDREPFRLLKDREDRGRRHFDSLGLPIERITTTDAPREAWQTVAPKDERLIRVVAGAGIAGAALITALSLLAIGIGLIDLAFTRATAADLQRKNQEAVSKLVATSRALALPSVGVVFGAYNDLIPKLRGVGGWLKTFRYENEKVGWTVVIPRGVADDGQTVRALGGRVQQYLPDGRVEVVR